MQRRGLTRITAIADLPLAVTLTEAKQNCEVDHDDRDNLITRYIKAAARKIEDFTDHMIGEQQWRYSLDRFTDTIELPIGPVYSVDSIKYTDADGIEQTLDPAVYSLDLVGRPQWVVRNSDEAWPETVGGINDVRITFTCGSDTIDDEIALAVLNTVAAWYDNRSAGDLPEGVQQALQSSGYRMVRI